MASILDSLLGRASASEINAYGPGGSAGYMPALASIAQMDPATQARLQQTFSSPRAWLQSKPGYNPDVIAKMPTSWEGIFGSGGVFNQSSGVNPGPGYAPSAVSGGPGTKIGTTDGGLTRTPNFTGPLGGGRPSAPVIPQGNLGMTTRTQLPGSISNTPGGSIAPRQSGVWAPPVTPASYAGLVSQGRMGYVDPFQKYVSLPTPQFSGVNQTGTDITYKPMPKPISRVFDPSEIIPSSQVPTFTQPGNVNSAGPGVRPGDLNPFTGVTQPPNSGTGTPPPATGTPPPTNTPPPVNTRPGGTLLGREKSMATPGLTANNASVYGTVMKEQDGNPIDSTGGDPGGGSTTGGRGSDASSNDGAATTDPYQWTIWKPDPGGNVDVPYTQKYGGHPAPFSGLSDQIANAMAGFNVYSPLSWAGMGNPTFFQGRPANLGPLGGTGNIQPFVR